MYNSQRWKARGSCNLSPRDRIFHQTVSRLRVDNDVFLGSSMVHICQECHSLRLAPQRRHMAHLGLCPHGAPRKLSHQDWKVRGCKAHLGQCACQPPSCLSNLDREGRKTHSPSGSVPLQNTREPEQLRPGKYMKHKVHLGQCHCRAPWSLSSVDPGNSCCLGLWQAQCGPSTVSTLHTCQRNLFVVTISLHSTTEQVSLNE